MLRPGPAQYASRLLKGFAQNRRMPSLKQRQASARRLAIGVARVAHERHCTDIVVLDLRGISPVTDYFVISTGTSDRQMRAVAEEITATAAEGGHRPFNVAGTNSARWILLDFFDVVVHLFDDEYRRFYDLELIWGDAPRLRWRRARKGVQAGPKGKADDHGEGFVGED